MSATTLKDTNTTTAKTNKCIAPPEVMLSLLMAESAGNRELGYPYIIRINGNYKEIASKALDTLVKKKVIKRLYKNVYDCENQNKCTQISQLLINNGISNLDLGAFQINYYYHPKDKLDSFFSLDSEYEMACKYSNSLVKQYGYNWEALARYHSSSYDENHKYKRRLMKNLRKIELATKDIKDEN